MKIERGWVPRVEPMRQSMGGPKYNLRPTSTNSVHSNPLASILDHPNPTLMTVALTVTFQGRELLPTISVTYVVIPGLPGPPFLPLHFRLLRHHSPKVIFWQWKFAIGRARPPVLSDTTDVALGVLCFFGLQVWPSKAWGRFIE